MAPDESTDKIHQQKLDFEFFSWLSQLLEEPLSECLGVVYELYSGEQGGALERFPLVVSTQL